jgi:peptide deformylase
VDGYLARVMQHEFDHLEGVMYVDRITPFRKQMVKTKLKAIMQGKFRCPYRVKAAHK